MWLVLASAFGSLLDIHEKLAGKFRGMRGEPRRKGDTLVSQVKLDKRVSQKGDRKHKGK